MTRNQRKVVSNQGKGTKDTGSVTKDKGQRTKDAGSVTRDKKSIKQWGGGSENDPLCLNPILDLINMSFKYKLYINMIKFKFSLLFKGLF